MNTQSKCKRSAAAFIVAALGVCGLPQAQAQTEPQPVAQPRPHTAAPSTGFYAFGGFAALAAEKNSQLQGERGSPANLIAGGGYRLTPDLAVELNFLAAGRKLDTPPTAEPAGTFAAGTLKSTMGTGGIGATVKYSFAVQRFAPYFGGGVGAYTTTFHTRSEAPGCAQNCSDTGPRVEARSRDVGIHALAGVDYYITAKHVVAGEIRYLRLRADFGAIVPGKVDAGGAFIWAGFRRHF
jgi:outer membrane protein W